MNSCKFLHKFLHAIFRRIIRFWQFNEWFNVLRWTRYTKLVISIWMLLIQNTTHLGTRMKWYWRLTQPSNKWTLSQTSLKMLKCLYPLRNSTIRIKMNLSVRKIKVNVHNILILFFKFLLYYFTDVLGIVTRVDDVSSVFIKQKEVIKRDIVIKNVENEIVSIWVVCIWYVLMLHITRSLSFNL